MTGFAKRRVVEPGMWGKGKWGIKETRSLRGGGMEDQSRTKFSEGQDLE